MEFQKEWKGLRMLLLLEQVSESLLPSLFLSILSDFPSPGKTLSALASIVHVQNYLLSRSEPIRGSLILLPNNALLSEWIEQVFLHTRGVHVITQNAQGFLKSRGMSSGDGDLPVRATKKGKAVKVEGDCVVITTLARAREHPFSTDGWDLVVIDECLSVQNDSLQSSSSWRQCAASRCGTILLSATFFRSKLSKLYYMLRMFKSSLPRTEAYLPALLNEHAVVFLPENPRRWEIFYRSVKMDEATALRYRMTVEEGFHAGSDARSLYVNLKSWLRNNYEESFGMKAVIEEVERLRFFLLIFFDFLPICIELINFVHFGTPKKKH